MSLARPFKIQVPDSSLKSLRDKLAVATFPDEIENSGWERGSPLSDVQRLAQYWKEGYDWKAHERVLNELPHFTMPVEVPDFETLQIHFIHHRSQCADAIPLLFLHGWPGSFIEVTKILALLTEARGQGPEFHIIAPSLPGFGFSEGSKKKGFGLKQCSHVLNSLMVKLGYNEYVTQGGDWGSIISRAMAKLHPQHVKCSLLNFFPSNPPYPWKHPIIFLKSLSLLWNSRDRAALARCQLFVKEGQAYALMHESRPQTIGYALQDPVALLAWIYEKLHDWTDDYPWTDDEVLTWVSIYYFSTAGPAAPAHLYHEGSDTHTPAQGMNCSTAMFSYCPDVKLGLSYFPKEITPMPPAWGHALGPVIFQSHHEKGGHFAAWENPQALAADLQTMFGRSGPAFGIVKGKCGYDVTTKM